MRERLTHNYKVFLTIWFGQLVSTLGSGLTNFGIAVWLVQHATHDKATAFSLSALSATLPAVLFGSFAGSLVDRWDRRKAMIVSAVGSGFASFILAVLVLLGALNRWEIYAMMALSSAFATFTWPAISAIVSKLVENKHLGRANAMLQFNEAVSMVFAPALAATIIAIAGGNSLEWLVVLDVVSFIVAIVALLLAKTPVLDRAPVTEHPPLLQSVAEGFSFIFERKGLLGLLTFFLVINFTLPFAFTLFTPLVLSFFNATALGAVQSLGGIGMIVGTIGMSIWGGPKRRIYGVLGFGAAACSMSCLIGFPPSVPLYIASLWLMMMLFPVVNASSQAIWMRKTPNDMQGRIFAARRVIGSFMSPVALAISGPLADRVFGPAMMPGGALSGSLGQIFGVGPGAGIRLLFVVMGILSTATALIWMLNPHIRNVETELPDAVNERVAPHISEKQTMAPVSVVDAIPDMEGAFLEQ